jgi:hypothetical protein
MAGLAIFASPVVFPWNKSLTDRKGDLSLSEIMADIPPSIPGAPGGAVPPKKETGKVQPKKETVRINLPPKPSAAPTIKLPTLPFKIALYALCGMLFLSALFVWPTRALLWRIRRIREKRSQARASEDAWKDGSWLVLISMMAALASLFSLFCLALIVLVPNLVYFPWPQPWADLLWWQSAGMSLPFAGLGLAAGVALLAGLAMKANLMWRLTGWYYIAVALMLLAFNVAILI